MILINVKFRVKPEHTATFLADIDWFTTATRAEPGNLFFDWYQSPADPGEFILVEGFHDDAAEPHVNSEHFQRACRELPGYLVETPRNHEHAHCGENRVGSHGGISGKKLD